MASSNQVRSYWVAVEEFLKRRDMGAEERLRAILEYRIDVERVGEILYHQKPEDTAAAITSGGYARLPQRLPA